MHLKLTAADKTDVGRQREQNEDTAYKRIESFAGGDRGLFIVADGMGGYKAGEVASMLAIETMSKSLHNFFKTLPEQATIKLDFSIQEETEVSVQAAEEQAENLLTQTHNTRRLPESFVAKSIEDQLKSSIQQANKAILRYGEEQSAARGLGCTVTAALIQDDQAYIANIGDSRTYLLRNGKLKALTKDHSLVARLVEAKQIEPDDIYSHPQRNLIYRSLGAGHKKIEVDVFHETLSPNDMLLLCSDGLWEMVRQQDLLKTMSHSHNPQDICNTLIDLANMNGGEDNITAIVVQVHVA